MNATPAALFLLALVPAQLASAQTYAVLQYESFWPQVSTVPAAQPSTCFVSSSAFTDCAAEDIEVTMTNPSLFQYALPEAADSPDRTGRRRFEASFNALTEAGLTQDNPSGQYLYDIFTPTDPLCADSLTFNQPFPAGGGGWPSMVPALSGPSFSALASLDVAQPLTLTFAPYTPFAGADYARTFVYVLAPDQAFAFDSDLPNTATSVTIPAGTFQPGTPYTMIVRYFAQRNQTVNFRDHALSFGRSALIYFTTAGSASCTQSDIAGPGQSPGPDGVLTADDIIVFLNRFFAGNLASDVSGPGQNTTALDGQLTADDIIVFLNRFFAGC